MSLKHDNFMGGMRVQSLSLLERNYLIVSSDSLLVMCQSINIITPKRKFEVIRMDIFNRKRWLPSYHTGYACICLALDTTTPYKDVKYVNRGQVHSMSQHFPCTSSSFRRGSPSLNSVALRPINSLERWAKNPSAQYTSVTSSLLPHFSVR